MDQYISEIIVVVITSVFSLVTLIVQKKHDKVVDNIDKRAMFMEKMNELRQKLNNISRERESIIHNMMILIMDTNLELMKSLESNNDAAIYDDIYKNATKLKDEFEDTNRRMEDINKEYNIVAEMAKVAQDELEKLQQQKK